MKKILRFLTQRVVLTALLILIQALLLFGIIWKLNNYFIYFYAFSVLLSLLLTLRIINNKSNPAFKIAWLIPILLFPVLGGLVYLVFGSDRTGKYIRNKMGRIEKEMQDGISKANERSGIEKMPPDVVNQSHYISNSAHCPPYKNTTVEYLPMGEVKFERMVQELKKAKRYIFMEYFIIQEGTMWNTILDVLEEKAKEGVDVRVIYDDMGCILTLPTGYEKTLREKGIQCQIFNPFIPILSSHFNTRDHRKICVIDGNVGFTGGINLADEYINGYEKHGHWKDTAILLKGEAVFSLTTMFLSMWDYLIKKEGEDYAAYYPDSWDENAQGIVQPFADNPLDDEAVGETVYLNLINKAKRYVYITTPYLILSNEMVTAMNTAAKSGVDVRIITPHVPDKWYVHAVSRSYYEMLVEAGVKIYEYTPGFVHAKTFVVDDEYAVVGTINLDYRSLYLHFECAAWMYKASCVTDVRDDFLKTQQMSQEITLEKCRNISIPRRLGRSVLRVLAPLM
ncbi:MAG: cardiolipin synthase [Negativibacillus sp.]